MVSTVCRSNPISFIDDLSKSGLRRTFPVSAKSNMLTPPSPLASFLAFSASASALRLCFICRRTASRLFLNAAPAFDNSLSATFAVVYMSRIDSFASTTFRLESAIRPRASSSIFIARSSASVAAFRSRSARCNARCRSSTRRSTSVLAAFRLSKSDSAMLSALMSRPMGFLNAIRCMSVTESMLGMLLPSLSLSLSLFSNPFRYWSASLEVKLAEDVWKVRRNRFDLISVRRSRTSADLAFVSSALARSSKLFSCISIPSICLVTFLPASNTR
mmetsp:Transcript_23952/g.51785  ORF Transcript_23952/g.51785 Transcript_23952/m.51785 type:complete len:274 (-) Transcript_23952:227-1048(-)